jgi:hypothetical protein
LFHSLPGLFVDLLTHLVQQIDFILNLPGAESPRIDVVFAALFTPLVQYGALHKCTELHKPRFLFQSSCTKNKFLTFYLFYVFFSDFNVFGIFSGVMRRRVRRAQLSLSTTQMRPGKMREEQECNLHL